MITNGGKETNVNQDEIRGNKNLQNQTRNTRSTDVLMRKHKVKNKQGNESNKYVIAEALNNETGITRNHKTITKSHHHDVPISKRGKTPPAAPVDPDLSDLCVISAAGKS